MLFLTLSAGILCVVSSIAAGQNYPVKPIRLVTGGVGGGSDFTLRLIAQGLTASFGHQVVVENRGGASGAIAVQAVSKAAPDGYTLLYYSSSLWLIPLLQDVPWDTLRDFAPITLAASAPNILVVHPSLPVRQVRELIALAKARPGELNYASGVTGSSIHLAAELFKAMAGVRITRINYKGAVPAVTDLIAGQVQLMFTNGSTVAAHVKTGRLKALAVTSARPSAVVPGLPTMSDAGLPGFESGSAYAMFAPVATPAAIVTRLNREIVRFLGQADVREKFLASGVEPVASSPEQLTAAIKSEQARMGKLIREANIRVE